MKLFKFLLSILLPTVSISACVTEKKEPENSKPYVATLAQDKVLRELPPTTKGESLPGSIVIRCRSKYDKDPKSTVCGATTVKLLNEITKAATEHSFKGDKATLPVTAGTSFSVEVKTKGCTEKRAFSGMIGGMILTAQFENCAVK